MYRRTWAASPEACARRRKARRRPACSESCWVSVAESPSRTPTGAATWCGLPRPKAEEARTKTTDATTSGTKRRIDSMGIRAFQSRTSVLWIHYPIHGTEASPPGIHNHARAHDTHLPSGMRKAPRRRGEVIAAHTAEAGEEGLYGVV